MGRDTLGSGFAGTGYGCECWPGRISKSEVTLNQSASTSQAFTDYWDGDALLIAALMRTRLKLISQEENT